MRTLVSAALIVLTMGEIIEAQSGGFRSREEPVSKRQAQILSAIFPAPILLE